VIVAVGCSGDGGQLCGTPGGTPSAQLPPGCGPGACNGDGQCGADESCSSCPADCGACEAAWTAVQSATERKLIAIHGSSAADIWAVGERGTIVRWQGERWEATPSPTTLDLVDVWASGPDAAWAVGDRGTLLRWDGQRWAPDTGPGLTPMTDLFGGPPVLVAVRGSAADDVWVVPHAPLLAEPGGDTSLIHVALHWQGTSWSREIRPATGTVRRLAVTGPGELWVMTDYDPPQRRLGGGWREVPLGLSGEFQFYGIWAGGGDDLWLVADILVPGTKEAKAATVMHWDGRVWEDFGDPLVADSACWSAWGDGRAVWISCDRGAVLRHDGDGWHAERVGDDRQPALLGIWGSSAADIWAVGSGGAILHRGPP
jgi:hypothetical protein